MTSTAIQSALQPIYRGCEKLRAHPDRLVPVMLCAWIIFVVTGGRMPWQPIMVSDENSGGAIRQVFFTLGFMIAVKQMLFTGTMNKVFGYHCTLLVLGLWMLGSVTYSNDMVLTVKRSILYLFGFTLVTCALHQSKAPMRSYLRTATFVTGCLAWVSLAAFVAFPKHCTTIEERPGLAGVAGHPNVLGPCLFMAFCLSLGLTPQSSKEKLFLRFNQAGLAIALLISNSVTAIISTMIGTAIFVMMTTTSYRAGSILLMAIFMSSMVNIIGVKELKSMAFDAMGRDESMSGRDTLWADVFNEGMKSPVFGSGYGAFWYEGRGREITGTWNPRQSHNAYIDVFVDIGVTGLIFVIIAAHSKMLTGWMRVAGKRGSLQRKSVSAIVAMGIALCFVGAFGESFLLKMEKYQFFVFSFGMMVLENMDTNRIENEFDPDRKLYSSY